jgi:hypothetical protein
MTTAVSPEIEVEITLLPLGSGGRNGPILQGEYRGILGVADEHFSVRFFVRKEFRGHNTNFFLTQDIQLD